jgi:hypothetical protein
MSKDALKAELAEIRSKIQGLVQQSEDFERARARTLDDLRHDHANLRQSIVVVLNLMDDLEKKIDAEDDPA